MKCIFLLSGEDLDLAREEVLALADTSDYWMFDNVLVLEADFRFKRLAMTRKVYQHLFECSYKELNKRMAEYDWKKVYDHSFALRITNLAETSLPDKEAALAKYIWEKVQQPRVDLKHAKTKIEIIVTEEKVFVGKLIVELPHDFNQRRPSMRPGKHPTTLSPKLARACVNLSGVPVGKVVVDPFCGTGGMLIEAGMMRFNTVGYDVSQKMLDMCQKNLDFHSIKRYHLEKRDATHLTRPVDYVISDLPYGKGSHVTKKIEELYKEFLKVLWDILKYKAVIIFPNFIDHKELLAKTDFIVENEFNIYVHKSLSRNIVVLSKPVKTN